MVASEGYYPKIQKVVETLPDRQRVGVISHEVRTTLAESQRFGTEVNVPAFLYSLYQAGDPAGRVAITPQEDGSLTYSLVEDLFERTEHKIARPRREGIRGWFGKRKYAISESVRGFAYHTNEKYKTEIHTVKTGERIHASISLKKTPEKVNISVASTRNLPFPTREYFFDMEDYDRILPYRTHERAVSLSTDEDYLSQQFLIACFAQMIAERRKVRKNE
ncbi:MAG: hypothetical protein Q8Q49_01825 [bacterium]|nr:hypothetical protein [bacterium]